MKSMATLTMGLLAAHQGEGQHSPKCLKTKQWMDDCELESLKLLLRLQPLGSWVGPSCIPYNRRSPRLTTLWGVWQDLGGYTNRLCILSTPTS